MSSLSQTGGNSPTVGRACSNNYDDDQVTAGAFAMRAKERPLKQISADWVECIHDAPQNRTEDGSVQRLKDRLSQNGKLSVRRQPVAFLAVKEIRAINVRGVSVNVSQGHSGKGLGACHQAISGFTDTPLDLEIQEALAAIANRRPVKWIE